VSDRIVIVRDLIARQPAPASLDILATSFKRRPKQDDLAGIVKALVDVGVAREIENGRYVA
jgi:hypothetical protein